MTSGDQYDSFEKSKRGVTRRPGEIFTAFKVTASADKNEGRFGGIETVGVFFTSEAAERAAKGQDVMGTDGKVESVQAIMGENGNAYEVGRVLRMVPDAELREQALAKLTDEEKRVLGLRR